MLVRENVVNFHENFSNLKIKKLKKDRLPLPLPDIDSLEWSSIDNNNNTFLSSQKFSPCVVS